MSRVRSKDLARIAESNANRADAIRAHLPALLARVPDWTAGGVSTSDGPKVSGGDIHDTSDKLPTNRDGDLVERRDDVARQVQTIQRGLKTIASALATIEQFTAQVEAACRKLEVMPADEARRLAEEEGAQTWECCNPNCRQVSVYSGSSRPRAGRCKPCYDYMATGQGERPHRLIHRTPAAACEDCKRVHTTEAVA